MRFEHVSSNPGVSISILFVVFTLLYGLSTQSSSSSVDPLFFFSITTLYVLVLGVQQSNFVNFTQVLGFQSPFPGMNILAGVFGVGTGILFFSLLAGPSMAWFSGSKAAQVLQPFWMPLSSQPWQLQYAVSLPGQVVSHSWVAIGEEFMKLIIFKNIANFLSENFDFPDLAELFIAGTFAIVAWGAAHWWSWSGLTLGSFAIFYVYTVVFYLPHIIPDSLGFIGDVVDIEFRNIMIGGAITSHATYNVLVSTGPAALPLPFAQFAAVGLALAGSSLVGMLLMRNVFISGEILPGTSSIRGPVIPTGLRTFSD